MLILFSCFEVGPEAVASQVPSPEQVIPFSHFTGENHAESKALQPSRSPFPNYSTVKDRGRQK